MKKNLFVVIPAYNEAKTLKKVILRTKSYVNNIVVVDDGSKDNTAEIAEKEKVHSLKHMVNLGKGAALRTGCDYASEQGADVIIVMDADGQHDPKDIPRFIEALKGKDIVFGSREKSKRMPLVFRFGNWVINNTSLVLYGMKISDTQSGYRAFKAEVYPKIRWESNDYSMESEMIVNAGKKKLRYEEIFIKTLYSDKYKGTTVIDGVKIVFQMLLWKLRR